MHLENDRFWWGSLNFAHFSPSRSRVMSKIRILKKKISAAPSLFWFLWTHDFRENWPGSLSLACFDGRSSSNSKFQYIISKNRSGSLVKMPIHLKTLNNKKNHDDSQMSTFFSWFFFQRCPSLLWFLWNHDFWENWLGSLSKQLFHGKSESSSKFQYII